jgi:hypothetical protein
LVVSRLTWRICKLVKYRIHFHVLGLVNLFALKISNLIIASEGKILVDFSCNNNITDVV